MQVPTAVYNYCRVSTVRQGDNGLSLEEQRDRCARYALEKGWNQPEVVTEVGSAYSKQLPKLKELLSRAIDGSMILVTTYDRFSRNLLRASQAMEELVRRRVRIFSIQEQQDTLTPVGRYTFHLTVAAAEFNSANTGAKIRATVAKRKREGIEYGRAVYGEKIVRDYDEQQRLVRRRKVVNEEEATVIKLMVGLRDGITVRQATRLLNSVLPLALQAPVEFFDDDGKPINRVSGLTSSQIADLLNEYEMTHRDKPWTGPTVQRIIARHQAELDRLDHGLQGL